MADRTHTTLDKVKELGPTVSLFTLVVLTITLSVTSQISIGNRLDAMQAETNRRFDAMQAETNRRFDAMQAEDNRRFDAMQAPTRSIAASMNCSKFSSASRGESPALKGKQALPNDDPSESCDYGWLRSFVTCTPAVLFGIPASSPCVWNDDRRHLRARLGALYFHSPVPEWSLSGDRCHANAKCEAGSPSPDREFA